MLLCNNTVSISDVSHGMTRRLMVIPFDHTFSKEAANPGLFERIWATEMPGILKRAVEGFGRVVQRGSRFKEPEAVRRSTAEWIRAANPLPAFLKERCEEHHTHTCWMKEFYSAYCDWAEATDITFKQQQRHIRENLKHLSFTVEHGNEGDKIFGLRLKKGRGNSAWQRHPAPPRHR